MSAARFKQVASGAWGCGSAHSLGNLHVCGGGIINNERYIHDLEQLFQQSVMFQQEPDRTLRVPAGGIVKS